jgi:hypothetical protein
MPFSANQLRTVFLRTGIQHADLVRGANPRYLRKKSPFGRKSRKQAVWKEKSPGKVHALEPLNVEMMDLDCLPPRQVVAAAILFEWSVLVLSDILVF